MTFCIFNKSEGPCRNYYATKQKITLLYSEKHVLPQNMKTKCFESQIAVSEIIYMFTIVIIASWFPNYATHKASDGKYQRFEGMDGVLKREV